MLLLSEYKLIINRNSKYYSLLYQFTVIFHKTSEYKYYFQNMIKILIKFVKLKC